MSNLGFQWVYRLFNRVPDLSCERFFFEEGEPAVTFETGTPLSDFGLLAWSLSWEMDIVNILRTLTAAGIPARREPSATSGIRLLLVGGDIARMNPAALSPFVDIFALGDGERLVPRIAELLQAGLDRDEFLRRAAALPGFFVPAVHGPRAEAAEKRAVVVQQPMSRKEIAPDFEVPAHDDPDAAHRARRQAPDRDLARLHRDVPLLLGRLRDGARQAVSGRVDPEGRARGAAADGPRGPDRDGRLRSSGDHPDPRGPRGARVPHRALLHQDRRDRGPDPRGPRAAGRAGARDRAGSRQRAAAPPHQQEGLRRDAAREGAAGLRARLHAAEALPPGGAAVGDRRGRPRHRAPGRRGSTRSPSTRASALGRVAELVPSVNAFIPKPHTPYEDEALHDEE